MLSWRVAENTVTNIQRSRLTLFCLLWQCLSFSCVFWVQVSSNLLLTQAEPNSVYPAETASKQGATASHEFNYIDVVGHSTHLSYQVIHSNNHNKSSILPHV